jgi:hypothetical protein
MTKRINIAVIVVLAAAASACHRPVERLAALNGCYEGEGLPDIMRPRVHWHFRLHDGNVIDRAGLTVSRVILGKAEDKSTPVSFTPGINPSFDEHRVAAVFPGTAIAGSAYLRESSVVIVLDDEEGSIWEKTSCG